MKTYFSIVTAYTLLLACNNNNSAQTVTANSSEVLSKTASSGSFDEGITGYWKLTLEAYDNNENKILDEDERKKGIQNRYSFRFNADGTCQIRESFKGRYEVTSKGSKKLLSIYRNRVKGEEEKDPPPDVYRIISLSKNELVLLEQEGNLTFWVFERGK